jgi:ABC-type lipoprotein release transport system permease subunit
MHHVNINIISLKHYNFFLKGNNYLFKIDELNNFFFFKKERDELKVKLKDPEKNINKREGVKVKKKQKQKKKTQKMLGVARLRKPWPCILSPLKSKCALA